MSPFCRACIGQAMGMLETRAAVAAMVAQYKLSPGPGMENRQQWLTDNQVFRVGSSQKPCHSLPSDKCAASLAVNVAWLLLCPPMIGLPLCRSRCSPRKSWTSTSLHAARLRDTVAHQCSPPPSICCVACLRHQLLSKCCCCPTSNAFLRQSGMSPDSAFAITQVIPLRIHHMGPCFT